jgi:hypothetical protein
MLKGVGSKQQNAAAQGLLLAHNFSFNCGIRVQNAADGAARS